MMTFTMKEIYESLRRWKADLQAAGKWTPRDDDMVLAIELLTAQPKEGGHE